MPKIMGSVNRITRCLTRYRQHRCSNDLNSCQHSLVLCICRHPGLSQEELAAYVCLDKSTVARAVAQLESKEYITRVPSAADKRQLSVMPTEKLLAVLPQIQQVLDDWYGELFAGIPETEAELFHSVLRRIEQNARTIVKKTEEGVL